MATYKRPAIVALGNGEAGAPVFVGGASCRPSAAVLPWIAFALRKGTENPFCWGHQLPPFFICSIASRRSLMSYRTQRPNLTCGISPLAVIDHNFLGEIARALLASSGVSNTSPDVPIGVVFDRIPLSPLNGGLPVQREKLAGGRQNWPGEEISLAALQPLAPEDVTAREFLRVDAIGREHTNWFAIG